MCTVSSLMYCGCIVVGYQVLLLIQTPHSEEEDASPHTVTAKKTLMTYLLMEVIPNCLNNIFEFLNASV